MGGWRVVSPFEIPPKQRPGRPLATIYLYQGSLIMAHLLASSGPPGPHRRPVSLDRSALVALRLWCAHHGANPALPADKGNRSNELLSTRLGITKNI